MQVAILLVLALIAVLIAPWLIGLILGAAAVYGLWVLAAAALCAVAFVAAVLYMLFAENLRQWRIRRVAEESNKRFRESQQKTD